MVPGSHPSRAAALMLDSKGIEYRRIDFAPAVHRVMLRLVGFLGRAVPAPAIGGGRGRGGRPVPALRIEGRRVQGSRRIARVLDEIRPDPPLLPRDLEALHAVEQAAEWGAQVLQPLARRLTWAALKRDRSTIGTFLEGARLGLPRGVAVRTAPPLIHLPARLNDATDEAARANLAALPAHLDKIDAWIADGVLGGSPPNPADFQIATSLR